MTKPMGICEYHNAQLAVVNAAEAWCDAWEALHTGPTESLGGRYTNMQQATDRLRGAVADLRAGRVGAP